jgi:hypothetical protein
VIVKNASIVTGTGIAPFTGDNAFGSSRVVKTDAKGVREAVQALRVDDLGDMRVFSALETMDATGLFAVMNRGLKEGDVVLVSDWKSWRTDPPLAVGANTDVALLSPAGPGTYTVVRIIRTERPLGGT